jgi:hypothetical protein
MDIKAGLLQPKDGKLVPDQRRGLIRVAQEGPNMIRVMWFQRSGDAVSDEPDDIFMVMPQMNKAEFKQVLSFPPSHQHPLFPPTHPP